MENDERRLWAQARREAGKERLLSARHLLDGGFYRDSASRAYYAAFYAATAVCVLHGDSEKFPPNWNNPTHEQLPDLIQNNGDLSREVRERVRVTLRFARQQRETADYRVGRAITKADAIEVIKLVASAMQSLEER